MQVYLSVIPRHCREAMKYHTRLAHVAYRIGPDSHLLRQSLLMQTKGGLLSLSDRDCPPITRPEALCRELWQECGLRGYLGVLADFESDPCEDRVAFLRRLCALLRGHNRRLFLPERWALQVPGATAVICTALSGGSFQARLREAADHFGPNQTALDVQRLTMDFTLPSPTGMGTPLSREDFQAVWQEHSPTPFYSKDLCAKYFTYTKEGVSHFLLFDDADTIRRKIRTGSSMGLCAAFLMDPEVQDLLPALFRPQ